MAGPFGVVTMGDMAEKCRKEGGCTEVEGCAAEVDVKVAGEKFAVESVVDGKTEIQLQVSG